MKKIFDKLQIATIFLGILVIIIFMVPRLFGIIPFIVLSGSMEKEIKTGAIAYVNTNYKRENIQVGDIIAFTSGNAQVTHRVVSINEDNTYTTKGDANENVDFKNVKFGDYKGKTIFSIPYLGYIVSFIQTKNGYLIIFALVLLNLAYIIFSKDDKTKKIKDTKKNKQMKEGNKI